MNATAHVLPSAMQSRMDALKAENAPKDDAPTNDAAPQNAPIDDTPVTNTPADNQGDSQGERVTLSREEYNELKANSGRAATLQGREEAARMELDEMRHRLTELENSNKAISNAPESAPAQTGLIDASGIQFSEEEEESFGESREFIEKVVDMRVAAQLNKLLPDLRSAIEEAKTTASKAVGEVAKTNQNTFLERLTSRVPQIQSYINHPQWGAFLQEQDAISGFAYADLLTNHVNNQNLQQAVNVYNLFADKYVKPLPTNAGYAGATTGGGGGGESNEGNDTSTKMKLSDRKKAGEDYRKGRITYEELQEVNKKFQAADKAGNVDYNS